MDGFQVICEVEPPTRPDLKKVRHQIGVMSPSADAFLIPDNHIGRATVSSVAVANEVQLMGARGIACLNSRDRNLLGFRRDLLTAAAYGVDRFLFVYGDKPTAGSRTSELTVRIWCRSAAIERSQHVWNVISRHWAAGPRAGSPAWSVPARGYGG